MKLLLIFLSLISPKALLAVSDFARYKIDGKIFFNSDVEKTNNILSKIECVYGQTSQVEFSKKSKFSADEQIIFQIKLILYIDELQYDLPSQQIFKLLGNRLETCKFDISSSNGYFANRKFILSELYFQEYLLGFDQVSKKKERFDRLFKLLNKRFPHFSYEK